MCPCILYMTLLMTSFLGTFTKDWIHVMIPHVCPSSSFIFRCHCMGFFTTKYILRNSTNNTSNCHSTKNNTSLWHLTK